MIRRWGGVVVLRARKRRANQQWNVVAGRRYAAPSNIAQGPQKEPCPPPELTGRFARDETAADPESGLLVTNDAREDAIQLELAAQSQPG